jgi:hypothetical protein
MVQPLTVFSILMALGIAGWFIRRTLLEPDTVNVRLRLDRAGIGSHLMWDISNVGTKPLTVRKLIIRSRSRGDTIAGETVPLGLPQVLQPQEHMLLPTDVDWTLLSARSIAVGDAEGREHFVSRRQLRGIQEQLSNLIDRRVYTPSAKDWLYGATDMAFGVVILGLGFFMLMWVIATG